VADDTLGSRIRRLRMERGMSLAKVAGGDFSRAFLNQVELGRSQPSTRLLRVIANRLGAPVEYLLDGHTPSLDRQIALERARIDVVGGRCREALAAIEPALEGFDWPLAADSRICAGQALIGLGRRPEADRLLAEAEKLARARNDEPRHKRARSLRGARSRPRAGEDPKVRGESLVRLAERALRAGDHQAALERFREARVLLEATAGSQPSRCSPGADPGPAG
jgi:transcriptional regulator with XRE-family HTH domain